MATTPQERLKQWKADLEADLVEAQSDFVEAQQRRDQIQKLLEGVEGLFSGITEDSNSPPTAVTAPKVSRHVSRGVFGGLTRRQVVLQIIPEFEGSPFEPGDIREKFLERYPQANTKNFTQNISTLLRQMAEKGEIRRLGRRGDKPTDPFLYQANESQEESLTLGP